MKDDRHRLDKWLWHTRFFKTRSLATAAVLGGKVKVHGDRVKPAHDAKPGDMLTISIGTRVMDIEILSVPDRRGPASVAMQCYCESAASIAREARNQEQQRLAALSRPRSAERPDKRQRRHLNRLRRLQGE